MELEYQIVFSFYSNTFYYMRERERERERESESALARVCAYVCVCLRVCRNDFTYVCLLLNNYYIL